MSSDPHPGLGTAGFTLGVFGLATCWLFPLGLLIGACGLVLGMAGWLTDSQRGLAANGVVLSAAAVGTGVLLGYGTWVRLTGW